MKTTEFKPRKQQLEGYPAIIRGLEYSAGTVIPPQGLRGHAVAATGAGKTKLAAMVANELEPNGRVIVFMPTRDLVMQTIEAWREVGHDRPVLALAQLPLSWLVEHDVSGTTSAEELVEWAGSGPVTVFATYASLATREDPSDILGNRRIPGPLERAFKGVSDKIMEPFGLLIADEAHVTSGDLGKAWGAVHDNERIRAHRRLYLTATPRVWALPDPDGRSAGASPGDKGGHLVASMDNPRIFGPRLWTYPLSRAIDEEVLARFEIDVLEIRDPIGLDPLADPAQIRARRLAAAQAALVQHAVRTGTRTVISFHPRVLEAAAGARNLRDTAAELHKADPAAYPPPERVWGEFLYGEHGPEYRRDTMRKFGDGVDDQGYDTTLSVLYNAKVLGVGVDIRGRVGVGGVFFAEVRGAPNEVAQAVGRSLRQHPGEGKIARIIVPVYLQPGEEPDSMFASRSYQPLVDLLQALRAHDSELVEQLAAPQRPSSRKTSPLVGEESAHGAKEDQEEDASERARQQRLFIQFSSPKDPQAIADLVRTRVLRPEPVGWLVGLQAARAWHAKHGNLKIPRDAVVTLANGREYPAGTWIHEQRKARQDGDMPRWRIDLLNEIDMIWNPHEAAWEDTLAILRETKRQFGTLAVPRSTVVNGRSVGTLVSNLRRPGGLGRHALQRGADLAAIDPDWNCPWDTAWHRMYVAVKQYVKLGGSLADLTEDTTAHGEPVLPWIARQQAGWDRLKEEQRERLADLGVHPRTVLPGAAPTKKARGPRVPWEHYLAAARQYRDREQHLKVPRSHIEVTEIDGETRRIPLGTWRANLRQRRDKITAEQASDLNGVGLDLG
ncbi:DEAD/DEAH box helicase [Streptomyces xiamenensis]|uniref:DEAD/DEAH box helicase n=1 Tax=Streptomyces xiamenensis TaxID=408015 RepID=UPI0035E13DC4